MGIFYSQTVKNSVFLFLGVGIGFISSALIQPKIFTPEENGVIKLLVSIGAIIGQLCTLGFPSAIIKFKPSFETHAVHASKLTFKASFLGAALALLFCYYLFAFKPSWLSSDSSIFSQYLGFLPLIAVSTLFFLNFDALFRSYFYSTTGIVLKEVIQRILSLLLLFSAILFHLNFFSFISIYAIIFLIPPAALILIQFLNTSEKRKINQTTKIPEINRAAFFSVAGFGIVAGLSSSIIISLDALFIEGLIGTQMTGVYAVYGYFATLVLIPFRAMDRIASPLLSDAFNRNDTPAIQRIYSDSTLYLILLSGCLSAILLSNSQNILRFLSTDYALGIQALYILVLSNFLDSVTGVNTSIIANSKFFKFNTYFLLGLIFLSAVTNYLLIPDFGLTGASIATFVSILLYNLLKLLFIKRKFGLFPFSKKTPIVLIFPLIAFLVAQFIPTIYFNKIIWFDIFLNAGLKSLVALFICSLAFIVPGLLPSLPSKKQ